MNSYKCTSRGSKVLPLFGDGYRCIWMASLVMRHHSTTEHNCKAVATNFRHGASG